MATVESSSGIIKVSNIYAINEVTPHLLLENCNIILPTNACNRLVSTSTANVNTYSIIGLNFMVDLTCVHFCQVSKDGRYMVIWHENTMRVFDLHDCNNNNKIGSVVPDTVRVEFVITSNNEIVYFKKNTEDEKFVDVCRYSIETKESEVVIPFLPNSTMGYEWYYNDKYNQLFVRKKENMICIYDLQNKELLTEFVCGFRTNSNLTTSPFPNTLMCVYPNEGSVMMIKLGFDGFVEKSFRIDQNIDRMTMLDVESSSVIARRVYNIKLYTMDCIDIYAIFSAGGQGGLHTRVKKLQISLDRESFMIESHHANEDDMFLLFKTSAPLPVLVHDTWVGYLPILYRLMSDGTLCYQNNKMLMSKSMKITPKHQVSLLADESQIDIEGSVYYFYSIERARSMYDWIKLIQSNTYDYGLTPENNMKNWKN